MGVAHQGGACEAPVAWRDLGMSPGPDQRSDVRVAAGATRLARRTRINVLNLNGPGVTKKALGWARPALREYSVVLPYCGMGTQTDLAQM
jgi:hypothetical protein